MSARERLPLMALLTASFVSGLGSTLTAVVIPWFVLVTTGNATKTGAAAAVAVLPILIGGLGGGALVDRLGFARSSVLSDLTAALLTAAIPFVYHTAGLAFWQLLALVFLRGLAIQPGDTARFSLIPKIADRAGASRERANSLSQGTYRVALLIGPPLAGVLIALLGASNVLWLDAGSFLISAAVYLLGVAPFIPRRREDAGRASYVAETIDGLRFLRGDRLRLWMVGTVAVSSLISEPFYTVVMPVYARSVYGTAVDFGLMFSALAVGSLIGLSLYGLVGERVPRRMLVITAFLVRALSFWVLLLRPPLPVVLASIVVNASAFEPANPLAMVIIQERTPEAMLGRVFGSLSALGAATLPLGTLFGGVLIGGLGLTPAIVVLAGASLAQALALPFIKVFHEFDRTAGAVTGGARQADPALAVDCPAGSE